jgi:Heterokaryon incompatibility protein (HET)
MSPYDDLLLPSTKQCIRLLTIQPAKDRSAALVVELSIVPLDVNPQYAALSYCWGPATAKHLISCNNTILGISENLAIALTSIRSISSLPLWVDQICINQDDASERSAQVTLMKTIYSQATKTYIYLGELDGEESSDAGRVLETIKAPATSKIDIDDERLTAALRARIGAIKLAMRHPSVSKKSYDTSVRLAISQLIDRPYFTRKWIIQEIAMSRSLFCVLGSHYFRWDLFIKEVLVQRGDIRGLPMHESLHAFWLLDLVDRVGRSQPNPLLKLLYYTRNSKATDPRDHVFSLLGVATDSDDFPPPDYEKAIDQIYHQTSCSLVRQGSGFLMFHLVGLRSTSNGLPSWVVDWRDLDTSYPCKYFAWFHAGGRDGTVKLYMDDTILRTCGKIVDRVIAIAEPFRAELNLLDRLECYIKNSSDAFGRFYPEGTSKKAIQKDLASLLSFEMRCWSRDPDREAFAFDGNYQDVLRCWDEESLEYLSLARHCLLHLQFYAMHCPQWLSNRFQKKGMDGLSRLCQKFQPPESLRSLTEYEVIKGLYRSNVTECSLRWNFFKPTTRPIMTENRRLGLAPALTQTEDIVCVLLGAKAPLILRPSDNGTYKIVGEAYVQDIMFGAMLNDERYPVQDILIS